jgi:hypothetical protein
MKATYIAPLTVGNLLLSFFFEGGGLFVLLVFTLLKQIFLVWSDKKKIYDFETQFDRCCSDSVSFGMVN